MTEEMRARLMARLREPVVGTEVAEVLAGVASAMASVQPTWGPGQLGEMVDTAGVDAGGAALGALMEDAVRDVTAATAFLVVALRVLRVIAPEAVVWPPEVTAAEPEPEPVVLAPGPRRVQ